MAAATADERPEVRRSDRAQRFQGAMVEVGAHRFARRSTPRKKRTKPTKRIRGRVKNRAYYEAKTAAARAQFLVLASPAVDLGAALDAWGLGNPRQLGDGAGATLPRPKEVALLKRTQVVHKYLQLQIAPKATAPAFQRAVGK